MEFTSKPQRLVSQTLQYDHETLLTRQGGWTVMEVPTQPYAFTSDEQRRDLGWLSTLSLAALKAGRVTLKQVHVPTDVMARAEALDAHVRATGQPAVGWDEYLAGQTEQALRAAPTTKRVFAVAALGPRAITEQLAWRTESGQEQVRWWERRPQPLAPVSERERERFAQLARVPRQVLASGGYRARPVGVETVRALRRHAASRAVDVELTASRKQLWTPRDVVDEFADLEYRVGPKWVRVEGPDGSRYTTTLVCWGFPSTMLFPKVQPWLGYLDSLPDGIRAESDLVLDLVPMEKARSQIKQRQRAASDQRNDAARAGADLPREVSEMLQLGHELDFVLPQRRLPLAYGWARIRLDAGSPGELDEMVGEVERHMAGGPRIDVARPKGWAQLGLLWEGVIGEPVKVKSYKQRWMLETAACSLQHSGSELGHEFGAFRGRATGREPRAVHIDLHHAITRRSASDVEQPGGFACLGAQRSGKSSAFAQIIDDAMEAGTVNLTIDPSRRLREVYLLHEGADDFDLVSKGGGIIDPLGPLLIPLPAEAVPNFEGLTTQAARARETARARLAGAEVIRERAVLARETLSTIAWKQIAAAPDIEGTLLNTINRVAASAEPSLAEVVLALKRSKIRAVKNLGDVLAFDVGLDSGAGALFGHGASADDLVGQQVIGRVLSMHGLKLPRAGRPVGEWTSEERLGAATFGCAAHLGRRLLFGMNPNLLKLFLVDEAHVPLGTDAGRGVIESTLRDGPKHGVVTGLATHNAADLMDEKIMAAVAMWFLFRTKSAREMAASFEAAGIPDTRANREQRAGLMNGECIAKLDTDVTDRFQWELWRPGLAEAAKTTSTGLAGGLTLKKAIDVIDQDMDLREDDYRSGDDSDATGMALAVQTGVLA